MIALLSTGQFDGGFTLRVLRRLAEFLALDLSNATLNQINALLRKLAHVTEYCVLGLLLWRALRAGAAEAWKRRWALGTLGLGILWAASDETHQLFSRGRVGSVADVGYDTLGVLLALLLLYIRARREGTTSVVPKAHQ